MISVTKPYLPNREKLDKYIDGIYERNWLTNNGPLVQELTDKLEEYLGVENLLLVGNGTLALQIAYQALSISETRSGQQSEVITTPFTFIATASSLNWQGIKPVFADIDPDTWCLDPSGIEEAIAPNTQAIVPVHVFGNACEVEKVESIASKHNLKIIYDASHAFGVRYKGQSLLRYGDAATLSFHATKLFHTVEGGAIIFRRKEDLERAKQLINFGLDKANSIIEPGINAKMSEFHAAVGLCVLDEMFNVLSYREEVVNKYVSRFSEFLKFQKINKFAKTNYSYMPVLLDSNESVEKVIRSLDEIRVSARRYFNPCLSSLSFLNSGGVVCKKSKDVADRVLCLPLYAGIEDEVVSGICDKVIEAVCE